MPDDFEMEEFTPAAPASSDKIYVVMLIIAAAFFLVAIFLQYLEYSECYSGPPPVQASAE